MVAEFVDAMVWVVRLALLAGLGWGAWLCLGQVWRETQVSRTAPRRLAHAA